tara:strand:- start:4948 stop:5184 length:237 start_codon:yes stop_codon:yes gene_type:complete
MSQVVKIQDSYIQIPTDIIEMDKFIGRWRNCQELAIKDIEEKGLTYKNNIDDIIDALTIQHYKQLRRLNVYRRKLDTE